MLRGSLIDGSNTVLDRDYSKLLEAVSDPGVVSGLGIVDGKLQPGRGFVSVTRASTDSFYCLVENTAEIVLDITGTKKIWLEVKQSSIDDGIANASDGSGIVEVKTGASYPTKNFLKIASVVAGVVTDDRYILDNIQDLKQALQDQLDTHEGRLDTAEGVITSHGSRLNAIESSISSINVGLIAGETLTANQPLSLNGVDGKVYVGKANSVGRNNFIGFSNGAYNTGDVVSINRDFCAGLSGLTIGVIYFLSDTLGAISTTPGTNRIQIGQAVSTTKIVVDKSFRSIIAGTTYTAVSLPTARTTSGQTWVKVKEAKIPKTGTYTVSFDLVNSASPANAHGRIYKNGVAIGTDQSQGSSTATKTESFAFNEGDLVQLYIYQTLTGGYVTTVSNFTVKYALQEDFYVCSDTVD